ncbi:MAG: META domain-containing protein [Methanomicrobiales archaeon]|nr:META domain-containing protein [Methanomicrobiales archaeon]
MQIEKNVYQRSLAIAAFLFITCVMCTGGAFASFILVPGAGIAQATDNSLTNTDWQLVSIDSGSLQVPIAAGSKVTLKFNNDGSIGGSGGINLYFGSYTQDGTTVTFGPIGCTEMAGPEPLMDQESTYFRLLDSARSFHIAGRTLELSDAAGHTVLKFKSDTTGSTNGQAGKDPATVLPGTNWQLSSYSDGTAVVSGTDTRTITLKFDSKGDISGFSGVNTYFGSCNLDGNVISVGPLGSTKMAGPPTLMELETVYLNLLGSVTGASIAGDSLSLADKDGTVVLVFEKKTGPSQGRFSAFLPPGESPAVLFPGIGRPSTTTFIDRFLNNQNLSSSTGRFPWYLVQPGRGTVTNISVGNHQHPAFMPRYNDSITPPISYPGGPLY